MKTTKRYLLTLLLLGLATSNIYSQNLDWMNAPKPEEKIIDELNDYKYGGRIGKDDYCRNRLNMEDSRRDLNEGELYKSMLNTAKTKYGKEYPSISLRNFKYIVKDMITYSEYENLKERYNPQIPSSSSSNTITFFCTHTINGITYDDNELHLYKIYLMTATVVVPDLTIYLEQSVEKALRNVPKESRMAINQIRVKNIDDEEDYKDKVVEILLDKGYKVVAKEFLERLYEEQKQQRSSIYNSETVAEMGNFSAVGYYLNVKFTETSLRVQIVNVSTGEYVGNITENF